MTPPPMLERECAVFARHLIGMPANAYVLRMYAAAHAARPDTFLPAGPFAAFTVRLASWSSFSARMADAWCRLFAPRGVLRRKLVLLLAILETAPPYYRELDAVRGSRFAQAMGLAAGAAAWLFALALGALVLLPARLALGGDRTP